MKNHTKIPILGFATRDFPVIEKDLSRRRNFQAGKNSQQGRLSATRGPYDRKQFSIVDFQINLPESLSSIRKDFAEVLKEDSRHVFSR